MAQPGVLFCLRQKAGGKTSAGERINPLSPHYLLFIHDSGEVRLAFTQAKAVLNLFRELATGKSEPHVELARLFDERTHQGQDMAHYSKLLQQSVESVAAIFQNRLSSGLQNSRTFLIPKASEQPQDDTEQFELVTWLVLMSPNSTETKNTDSP